MVVVHVFIQIYPYQKGLITLPKEQLVPPKEH